MLVTDKIKTVNRVFQIVSTIITYLYEYQSEPMIARMFGITCVQYVSDG